MSGLEPRPMPRVERGVRRRLIYALFAPPAAWALHEIVSLAILGRACDAPLSSAQWTGLVLISAAAVVSVAAAVMIGYRVFRHHRGGRDIFSAEGWEPIQFLALFATFTGSLLLLNILFFSVLPFLVVEPCMRSI